MRIHTSASAWWLSVSVPAWIIAINPLIGLTALLTAALVMLIAE